MPRPWHAMRQSWFCFCAPGTRVPPPSTAWFDIPRWLVCCGAVGALAAALVALSVVLWKRGRRRRGDDELAGRALDAIRENTEATAALRERMERASEDTRRLEDAVRGLRRDLGGAHWSKRSAEP